MNAKQACSLAESALVALAVLAACCVAQVARAAEPLDPARGGPAANGAAVWRQDLLERVTLRSTGAAPDLAAIKAQDSRKRLEKPEVAKWVKVAPKAGADGAAEPVTIVGCRNGAFSGQVVVSGVTGGFKVSATELKAEDGKATIPAAALELRYGLLDGNRRGSIDRSNPWFDGLEEVGADGTVPGWTAPGWLESDKRGAPPAAVQPVWVTVRVPRDAAAGQYSGSLSIASAALNAKVPVRLKVVDWVLPDSRDFVSHMGMFQSPEAAAMKYKVPMWSEEHWKLIERSMALLGQLGNDEVYITCINRTHLGNEQSMVRYVKQDDGGYKPDFSIAEKYLDLALKHFGKPPVICLYVWEFTSGHGWHLPDQAADNKFFKDQQAKASFAVLDPKTGALSDGEAPLWGTPESKAFWKPVLDGMREILRKRGLEKSLMLGLCGDARPRKVTEEDFKAIAPDVKWVLQSHPYQEKLWTQPLGLGAFVWGAKDLKPKHATELQLGWQPKPSGMIYCHFPRGGFTSASSPEYLRFIMESCLASGMNGVSRQGADFWLVDLGGKRSICVAGRYGMLPGAVRLDCDGCPYWLNAGRLGAIATASIELVRENIQESEARIFIEKALADPARSARLGADLEKRCREVLADRVNLILATAQIYHIGTNEHKVTVPSYVPLDWQGLSERLFAAAGEVAARLGPMASR